MPRIARLPGPLDKQWYDARTDPSDFSAKSNYGSSRLPGANRTISVASSPATETRAATPSIKDAVGTQADKLHVRGKLEQANLVIPARGGQPHPGVLGHRSMPWGHCDLLQKTYPQ